ncbi:MAG: ATP-binding protein [Bacteroidota bacterium]
MCNAWEKACFLSFIFGLSFAYIGRMSKPLKVVCTGPESTGKSTLATDLARYFQCPLVVEYARAYIDQLDRPYQEADLLTIAQGQIAAEQKAEEKATQLWICDTDLLTIKIWAEDKYDQCDPWIIQQLAQRPCDVYLLCGIDIPWEFDPQREDPHRREWLYQLYQSALQNQLIPHFTLSGNPPQRLQQAIVHIASLMT